MAHKKRQHLHQQLAMHRQISGGIGLLVGKKTNRRFQQQGGKNR